MYASSGGQCALSRGGLPVIICAMPSILFYIVTPTFNSISWLPQCVRSVADQAGMVRVHHHVQDGGSSDGTVAWLEKWSRSHENDPDYRFTWESAEDAGMYDAVNKAWERMPEDADFMAHLNSDEQYLPGALAAVAEEAAKMPEADILLGAYIILDKDSRYIAHRLPVLPRAWSSWLVCACITNSCFHRVKKFREHGIRFDNQWKIIGDLVFYSELARAGLNFALIAATTSAFICTGGNLAWTDASRVEAARYKRTVPFWAVWFHALIEKWVNKKRIFRRIGRRLDTEYSIYLPGMDVRKGTRIHHPTVRWKRRTVSHEPMES